MTSGLYKYIVFEPIERSTGKVYEDPCHRIMGTGDELPNTDWVGREPLVRAALLRAGAGGRSEVRCRGDRMKVLVTGGSGFIGSHVVDKLADAGFEPRIYDLRPSPHHESGLGRHGRRRPARRRRPSGARWRTATPSSTSPPTRTSASSPSSRSSAEECNSRGTLAVLEAARATGTRVIYGSTIWVYGASGGRRDRRGVPARACRTTSTRRASSPARCTAPPTPSSTTCPARSCASASPTDRARGPRR